MIFKYAQGIVPPLPELAEEVFLYNQGMMNGWAKLSAALAFFCVAILGVMGFPPQRQQVGFPLQIEDGELFLSRAGVLTLPAYVWLGDEVDVRFTVVRGGGSNESEGWIISARLESLTTPEPMQDFREPLRAGQMVSIRWKEKVRESGAWQARLRLEVIPVDQTGKQGEGHVLVIHRIRLPVRSWLGIPADRWRGGAGVGLGFGLAGWIWAVRRKGSRQSMLQ